MALSVSSVQKTYPVFHALQEEFFNDLCIPSWPQDMGDWDDHKKENPPCYEVFGWGKKSDDGWESISFFIRYNEVPEGLEERFEELCKEAGIGNTSICEAYHKNQKFFCIGWY